MINFNADYRSCQIKSKESFLKSNKTYKSKRISSLLNLSSKRSAILNLLVSMGYRYGTALTTPTQQWIADQVKCDIRWVNETVKYLNEKDLIFKSRPRYRKKKSANSTPLCFPCNYNSSRALLRDLEYLGRKMKENRPLIKKLWVLFPSFRTIFSKYFLAYSLFINLNTNLQGINEVSKSNITIFGQTGYEIVNIYKKRRIWPTSTLSNHYGNSNFVCKFPKKGNSWGFFQNHDPYEQSLIKKGECSMISKTDKVLSQQEIEIIKTFPVEVLHYVKLKLKTLTDVNKNTTKLTNNVPCPSVNNTLATNFDWIYNTCLKRYIYMNLSIKDLLKKHGYHYKHVKTDESICNTSRCIDQCNYLNDNQTEKRKKFLAFLGEDTIIAYMNRAHLFDDKNTSE